MNYANMLTTKNSNINLTSQGQMCHVGISQHKVAAKQIT